MTGHWEFGFEDVVERNRRQFVNFVITSGLLDSEEAESKPELALSTGKEADLEDVGEGACI